MPRAHSPKEHLPEGRFSFRAVARVRISRRGICRRRACGAGWHLPQAAGRHLPLAARVFISRRGRPDRSSVAEVAPGRGARGRLEMVL